MSERENCDGFGYKTNACTIVAAMIFGGESIEERKAVRHMIVAGWHGTFFRLLGGHVCSCGRDYGWSRFGAVKK